MSTGLPAVTRQAILVGALYKVGRLTSERRFRAEVCRNGNLAPSLLNAKASVPAVIIHNRKCTIMYYNDDFCELNGMHRFM